MAPAASGDYVFSMRHHPVCAAALGAVWLYKRTLSPVFYLFGARCRHQPSCSDYAAEAFRRHDPHRAFWLSLSRISRCHPWGSHGFDPVPDEPRQVGWRIWRLGDWAWTERGARASQERAAALDERGGL